MRVIVKNLVRDEIRELGRSPAHVAFEDSEDIRWLPLPRSKT
jgi:hypothetical protein